MTQKIIPQAQALPWLGHMPQMARDPLQALHGLALDHGPIVRFTLLGTPYLLISDPAYIREVLVTQAEHFPKADRDLAIMGPLLGYGLLTTNGAQHRTYRKLAQPAFHAKRIVTYADAMTHYATATADRWHDGATYDMSAEMLRTTMYIVAKTLFNTDATAMGAEADAIGAAIHHLQEIADYDFTWLDLIPQWVPTRENRLRKRSRQQIDALIDGMIAARRAGAVNGEVQDQGDLLSMLLLAEDEEGRRLTDAEVRDEAINLFVAGHETTSNALTWTSYLLAEHPMVMAKLQAELDQVLAGRTPTLHDLGQLPYTAQVIKEAMRLYPPAWVLNTRQANADVTIDGYTIAAGTKVFVAPYVMHRLPQYFDTPDQFRPERFTQDFEEQLPRFAYMPFGGGPRICIGNSFAMMEAQLVLATIAQRYTFHLAPQAKVATQPLITLMPKYGMLMQVEERRRQPQTKVVDTAVNAPTMPRELVTA